MAKKLSTYRLEENTRALLKLLAEKEKRSEANMIEVLVDAAASEKGISLPVVAKKKASK